MTPQGVKSEYVFWLPANETSSRKTAKLMIVGRSILNDHEHHFAKIFFFQIGANMNALRLNQLISISSLSFLLVACGGQQKTIEQSASLTSPPSMAPTTPLSFLGTRNNYRIIINGTSVSVTDTTGPKPLARRGLSDKLSFSDVSVDLSLSVVLSASTESQLRSLIELYIAFFNRVPDAEGMHYWLQQMIDGKTLLQIADSFYAAGKLILISLATQIV